MFAKLKTCWIFAVLMLVVVNCQREASIPLTSETFRPIIRSFINVPKGRSTSLNDIRIAYYRDSLKNQTSYNVRKMASLLNDKSFDLRKPTVLYIYGYVELVNDNSVATVVNAYIQRGDYNVLVLDWSNLGYGNYVKVMLDVEPIGIESGNALVKLLERGVDIRGLHIVGHSMGVHIGAVAARYLSSKGYTVPRLTGLDPAFPGFYPPLFTKPVSSEDAQFVDLIHTAGGQYGSPSSGGHADFWPNEGTPKQPGCIALTIPFSAEHFCSHWRSWHFWAESVAGGNFVARECEDYDSFLRGICNGTARMGLQASSNLRGNFYLRTAAKEPYALGERGAV